MIIDISRIDKKKDTNVLFLCHRAESLHKIEMGKNEITFILRQHKNKQNIFALQYQEPFTFTQIIPKEKTENQSLEKCRTSGEAFLSFVEKFGIAGIQIISIDLDDDKLFAFLEGLILSSYRFDKYKKQEHKSRFLKRIFLTGPSSYNNKIENLLCRCQSVAIARDLVNEPANYLNAGKLANQIKQLGDEAGFSVEILGKKKIESLRMGGILAVNKGSSDPPTFSILEWKPEKSINKKPVILIGKGITYDTGGLSLKKTENSMDYMKSDMAGAAAVTGVFYSVARLKLPVHLIGLIPATDNRPGTNAYAPGDIIIMHEGTRVEIANTDAEGRLVLADALSYANNYDPELIITMATLTGSAMMAIGPHGIVGMGNAPGSYMKALKRAGNITYERIVEFPFWQEYKDSLKSEIADIKNLGGKYGGAISAGKFLEHFTRHPLLHLDIAGPAFSRKKSSYRGIGGTGAGVRLLIQFIMEKYLN